MDQGRVKTSVQKTIAYATFSAIGMCSSLPCSTRTIRVASESVLSRCVIMISVRSLAVLGERIVNQLLTLDVDLAGRFIENQNFGVSQEGPRQRDPLPLAAAKPLTVRAAPS